MIHTKTKETNQQTSEQTAKKNDAFSYLRWFVFVYEFRWAFLFLSFPRHAICQKQSQPIILWSKCNWIGHIQIYKYTYVRSWLCTCKTTVVFLFFIHLKIFTVTFNVRFGFFFRVLHVRYVYDWDRGPRLLSIFMTFWAAVLVCCRHSSQVIFISFSAYLMCENTKRNSVAWFWEFLFWLQNLTLIGAYCRNISETIY